MAEYICSHCGKPIYDDDALLCLYCGESLNRGVGFLGKMKYMKPKIIIVTLMFLLLFCFILLVVF